MAIRIPRPRRGRRPRRPASFVLRSRRTDRHTSVATLVRDDRPTACALRGADPHSSVGEGLAPPADLHPCPTNGRGHTHEGHLAPPLRSGRTGGRGHGLGARPYAANGHSPVGAIHESPADMGARRTSGRVIPAPTQRTFSTPNSNPSRPARHHNYSFFIIHYSFFPVTTVTTVTAFPPVTSCHKPSHAAPRLR